MNSWGRGVYIQYVTAKASVGHVADRRTHLYGVELDAVYTVHAPREASDWLGPTLVPNIHALSTRGKHVVAPVVIHGVEHLL